MTQKSHKIAHATGADINFSMPESLQQALQISIQNYPNGQFVFVESLQNERSISFNGMLAQGLNILGNLQQLGCKSGDHIVLDASSPIDFIPALWGVLLGGMIAVPLAASKWNTRSHREFSERLQNVYFKLTHPIALSNQKRLFHVNGCTAYSYEQLNQPASQARLVHRDPTLPATMISTSGTTGKPQLVVLSGRALMHRWWPSGPESVNSNCFLNWMPFDHVMGLGLASPNCQTKVNLDTESFIKNPTLWTSIVEKHQVSHAGMSNFGMKLIHDYCANSSWQLNSLKKIGVGTEMISSSTCLHFLEMLTRCGAPDDVVILGYGLSECGPVAGGSNAFTPATKHDYEHPPLIDKPTPGHAIRIVNAHGEMLYEQEIGQIEVCGPTITNGYYADEDANSLLFTADGWLKTGDVGYLVDGQVCVTGRIKETISMNAEKYSCAEMDALIGKIPGVQVAHVFNFDETALQISKLGLIYVADKQIVENAVIEAEIRKSFSETYGFGIHRCQRVNLADIPRTRTGKLQRHLLPTLLPSLQLVNQSETKHETVQDQIAGIMARFLDGKIPEPEEDFFALGGDSLGALMLLAAMEKELGIDVPPAIFSQKPTISAVIQRHALNQNRDASDEVELVLVQQGKSRTNLFLAPGIWGNNTYASQLASEIGDAFSVWTFHLNDKNKKMQSINAFAQACCIQLKRVQKEGPYHLAGHSFGGLIAYEMASHLAAHGDPIASLCIIDTVAKLEEREFGAATNKPKDLLVDHHRHISKLYLPKISNLHIHYFKAKDSVFYCRSDQSAGWAFYAKQGVSIYDIPGDHQSIVKGKPRQQIAKMIVDIMQGKSASSIPHYSVPEDIQQQINLALKSCVEGKLTSEIRHLTQAVKSINPPPYWLWMRLAHALHHNRDLKSSIFAYLQAVKNDPWPLTSYFRYRLILNSISSSNLAANVLSNIQNIEIDSPATAYKLGQIYAFLKDIASAKKCYLSGLTMFPQSLELLTCLVDVLTYEQHFTEAQQKIKQALHIQQENDVAFLKLGQYALKLNNLELADACFRKCIAIDPENKNVQRHMQKLKLTRQNTR